MEQRVLGRTGRPISLVGMGGMVVVGMSQEEADRVVSESFERGVTYFDVAPSYGKNQEAEHKLGRALKPHRHQVFLACKTTERTRDGAARELHRSLENLETSHFDLYQLHALTTLSEVHECMKPGGAIEALVEARDAGLVQHLGFTAHSTEAAIAAMEAFEFDTVLFPVNFASWYRGDFGARILHDAEDRGVARLAIKSMARRRWPKNASKAFPNCWYEPIADPAIAELALRFTLSQAVSAAIPPGDPELFRMAVTFAERFQPIKPEEIERLQRYTRNIEPLFRAA